MIEMYMTWVLVAVIFLLYLIIAIARYKEIMEELSNGKKD